MHSDDADTWWTLVTKAFFRLIVAGRVRGRRSEPAHPAAGGGPRKIRGAPGDGHRQARRGLPGRRREWTVRTHVMSVLTLNSRGACDSLASWRSELAGEISLSFHLMERWGREFFRWFSKNWFLFSIMRYLLLQMLMNYNYSNEYYITSDYVIT